MNMLKLLFCLTMTFTQGMQVKQMFSNKDAFSVATIYLLGLIKS